MAAPTENLTSHLPDTDRNPFSEHRQHSRAAHLHRRWQELRERESSARLHNTQLLQQFDRAQDALRALLARGAAMKTVRMEYERYLEESALQETAQRKRVERHVRTCLTNSEEEQMRKSTVSPQLPCQCPWISHTRPQAARFPPSGPQQPPGPSFVPAAPLLPPSILPHPQQLQQHQDRPDGASPQWNPWSRTAGAAGLPSAFQALWRQLHMDEPGETGGDRGSGRCSQELDVNPVRLSSGPAESSESGRDQRKRRGNTQRWSSHRDSSQESESDALSGRHRTRRTRSGGLAVGSPQTETMGNDATKREGDESRSCGEESGSRREEAENPEDTDAEKETHESNSGAEHEEQLKSNLGVGEEKSQGDEDDDDDSGRKDTTEEEEELEDDDEIGAKRKGSSSSQGEEEDERVENMVREGEEGPEEEEQQSDEAEEEESDSGDSIIAPQENRPRKIHMIQEEDEDQSGSKTGSSDESSDSDDIENVLAPQQQSKITNKQLRVEDEDEASDHVEIFQVHQQSDSDEFDHFYD